MKKIFFDHLKRDLAEVIHQALLVRWTDLSLTKEEIYNLLVLPPQKEMGHWAFGVFPLAKALKLAPPVIAQQVSELLQSHTTQHSPSDSNRFLGDPNQKNSSSQPSSLPLHQDNSTSQQPSSLPLHPYNASSEQASSLSLSQNTSSSTSTMKLTFEKVQNIGPYVNFFFSGKVLFEKLMIPILTGSSFKQKLFESAPSTMIEFSQPNTHKELHVGHMRNACLGDALVRLNRYAGVSVISTTFPGDVGTHVAKCLWYLKYHNQDPIPQKNRGEWLGKMYSKGHLLLEDREDTPDEVGDREKLSMILKQIEAHSGEYYDLWKETRQWSIDLMNEVYEWCDIHFDHWYWESDVDSDSVKTIKKYFAEGKLVESEGAIGMDLSAENLGFCVLLKSDGNGLYSTKDIELARRKFEEHSIERSVYVVDMRQALHFKQVFASLKRLGFPEADQCFHLQYNFVELPDGAMSSRKGNIVPLIQLVSQMEAHVKENYLSRYGTEWTQDEVNTTASIIAKGAIKYGMLKMDPNKKIVFDMPEWLKLDGDSGPYIQYAYARIQSILRKFKQPTELAPPHRQKNRGEQVTEMVSAPLSKLNEQNPQPVSEKREVLVGKSVNGTHLKQSLESPNDSKEFPVNDSKLSMGQHLKQPVELQLMVLLSQLNSQVAQAVESYRPNVLCNYLYEVAKLFSQFYHECSIGHAESQELKQDRLALAAATALVLKEGLALLGIPVPDKM